MTFAIIFAAAVLMTALVGFVVDMKIIHDEDNNEDWPE